jgi:alcohol dehydrogenase class IV
MDYNYNNVFSIYIPETSIGVGAVNNLGIIVKGLHGKNVLIATDQGLVAAGLISKVTKPLDDEGIKYAVFDGCKPDAPFSVIKRCVQIAKKGGHDMVIGLGGGSVMDTVKAVSVLATAEKNDIHSLLGQYKVSRPGLPTIMIPTTAGTAAEWTWVAVVTDDDKGIKRSLYSNYLHPSAVIVDPSLSSGLSQNATADTGIDALIHGIEAYTTWKANVISDMFAEQTIKLASGNLRAAFGKGRQDIEARYNMAVAASLGFCFIFTGLGLAHAMAYPLQLKSKISHGVSCALLIPSVMEFNLPANLNKYARIAEMMGEAVEGLPLRDKAVKSIDAVRKMIKDVELPQRLRDIGVKKEDIPGFVDNVLTFQPHVVDANPRDASKKDITKIYEAAW